MKRKRAPIITAVQCKYPAKELQGKVVRFTKKPVEGFFQVVKEFGDGTLDLQINYARQPQGRGIHLVTQAEAATIVQKADGTFSIEA